MPPEERAGAPDTACGAGDATPERPRPSERRQRVLLDPTGPALVEGPVEVVLPDGTTAVSDRFMTAICMCRRSRTYPWCDTSHRRRTPARRSDKGAGSSTGRDGGRTTDDRPAAPSDG